MMLRAGHIKARWSFGHLSNVEFEILDGNQVLRLHGNSMKPWASAESMESEAQLRRVILNFLPADMQRSVQNADLFDIVSDLRKWWEETGKQNVQDLKQKALEGRKRERANKTEQKLKGAVDRLLEADYSLEQVMDLVRQAAVDYVHKQ